MARFIFLLGILLASASASADWVIFINGQQTQVQAVEIAERAVHITTLAGKRWSVMRESVDVDATLAANQKPEPLETVKVVEAPPIPEPPVEPPPVEPPPVKAPPVETPPPIPIPPSPPRQTAPPPTVPIVERAPAPVTKTTDVIARPSREPERYRVALAVNGVRGADSVAFADSSRFELFKETASIDSVYRDARREGYEVGVQFRVAGPFALGATAQLFNNDRNASYTASLPHPFFFDQYRELSGMASGLTHEELALHFDVGVTKTWGPLTVDAFAGPSWFRARTEIVVDVDYEEIFPYDEVFFRGVQGRVLESEPIGYNVGANFTFRVASVFGVDFGARYSDARSTTLVEEGREIGLELGGLNFSAGLRFLFP